MKITSLFTLLFLFACSQPCRPKYSQKEIATSAEYLETQCSIAGFTPDRCNELVFRMVIQKRLDNQDVMIKCLQDNNLK